MQLWGYATRGYSGVTQVAYTARRFIFYPNPDLCSLSSSALKFSRHKYFPTHKEGRLNEWHLVTVQTLHYFCHSYLPPNFPNNKAVDLSPRFGNDDSKIRQSLFTHRNFLSLVPKKLRAPLFKIVGIMCPILSSSFVHIIKLAFFHNSIRD
jgi:hypothetical protein